MKNSGWQKQEVQHHEQEEVQPKGKWMYIKLYVPMREVQLHSGDTKQHISTKNKTKFHHENNDEWTLIERDFRFYINTAQKQEQTEI